MIRLQRMLILIAFTGLTLGGADIPLEKLIPKEKWEGIGLNKLTSQEQVKLAAEITKLLLIKDSGMAVIAPSVSTSMMARQVLARIHTPEVSLRHADQVLVVVRSSLYNPLMSAYANVSDLQKDAGAQLNIAGPNFHVYIFAMDDDLRVTQTAHQSFPADQ